MKQTVDTAALGPLAPLLADPNILEIMIDGPHAIRVEHNGVLEDIDTYFADEAALQAALRALIEPYGYHIDTANPMIDALLADGVKVAAVLPPISTGGTAIAIRKMTSNAHTVEDLIRFGSWSAEIVSFLRACVLGNRTILVSGGAGSGKTTVLNLLIDMIPPAERVIAVEQTPDLIIRRDRLVSLLARPTSPDSAAISVADLILHALKMRPERLIGGELRGAEIWPFLQALNTGHDGSMSLVHAVSPRDALVRLETMALIAEPSIPLQTAREQLGSALHLIVQVNRLADGRRRVTHVSEVIGMEREAIALRDIFLFVPGAVGTDGRIEGRFVATGYRPRLLDELVRRGITLPEDLLFVA